MAHRSTYKGDRRQVNTRIPVELFDAVADRAAELGVMKGDLVTHALCLMMQTPEHDPLTSRSHETEQMRMTA